ncbi:MULTISPECIES: histidine kinase [unclassified Streptomyces]|uniref:sensor histidine kinase n=1 Tax=unclassified Streptomyces TaxID=2593676 RepID=UPI002ED557EB|nr:histidine kinase [Streptomyces sp. NBC_00891]WSY10131.1 histidine kinase [Streptomyces sp. NBC_00890]WSZ11735.1 histidine kinase [Streptomyces sp. NBC_00869]WSZ27859.1 histidine kinase [Streptomyces sp. NBC_00870]
MFRGLRPLLRGSTYTGALFAYCGALASLPLLPFAALPALAWPSAPAGVAYALTALLWSALIAAVGLARTTRRVLIACARRMLAVPLPDPVEKGPRADRRRTPLWLLAQVALGWVAQLGVLLFVMGLLLPGGWAGAEAGVSVDGRTLRLDSGLPSWAAALGCLLLAAALCPAVTYALRWLAPRLLGPSPAERLALAAERERALAERNRLAHELHDSIGHTLTAATIQAAVAGEVLQADPVAARAALRSIEESSRAALEDLDYVLGVLREEHGGTAPARTLADLPELLDRLRHMGAVVEPELSGDLAQVRGTLSRAAYRILQEGLTNAVRHGAGGPVRVTVAAAPDALELTVVNRTGTGPGAFPTSGHGLPGLTERVRLLHGGIEAGPDGAGHWRLAVRLPVRVPA